MNEAREYFTELLGPQFSDDEEDWKAKWHLLTAGEEGREIEFALKTVGVTESSTGEAYTRYFEAHVFEPISVEDFAEVVKKRMKGTRCQHSYDCCGNYYSSGGQLIGPKPYTLSLEGTGRTFLVCESFSQNV